MAELTFALCRRTAPHIGGDGDGCEGGGLQGGDMLGMHAGSRNWRSDCGRNRKSVERMHFVCQSGGLEVLLQNFF